MYRLIAWLNARVCNWIYARASNYIDYCGTYEIQSSASYSDRLGLVEYTADLTECQVMFADSYYTSLALGPARLVVHTEVGDDTPVWGSWIAIVLGPVHLVVEYSPRFNVIVARGMYLG